MTRQEWQCGGRTAGVSDTDRESEKEKGDGRTTPLLFSLQNCLRQQPAARAESTSQYDKHQKLKNKTLYYKSPNINQTNTVLFIIYNKTNER